MEYVILKAVHPTWLVAQLPVEVAALLQYDPEEARDLRSPARGIAFLARGPGIVRVVSTLRAPEVVAVETVRNRFIASARLNEKLLFSLPAPVARHLGLQVTPRGPNEMRSTDDGVVWFLPAPEYYEYRAQERLGKPWSGPSPGGLTHLYLAKSVLPLSPELDALETRIESSEWRPRTEVLSRPPRGRR
jgi:hypothetical protein